MSAGETRRLEREFRGGDDLSLFEEEEEEEKRGLKLVPPGSINRTSWTFPFTFDLFETV